MLTASISPIGKQALPVARSWCYCTVPVSSHQYRDLIRVLADRFQATHCSDEIILGLETAIIRNPAHVCYTFDNLSTVIEKFLSLKGFDHFGRFVQDDGGPVGFRIVGPHPEMLDWLDHPEFQRLRIGFHTCQDGFRRSLWKNRSPETEKPLAGFLTHYAIKGIYLHGAKNPALINPDNWDSDFGFMQRPYSLCGSTSISSTLSTTNVELYPQWQAFLPGASAQDAYLLG